ncbi:MAG TPA: chemotaxis response regulator protein-glutamate methylesterase [Candidatus Paceibacterota bacterium]|nr:chemotaxis response regulator protein-glutamate methylesterase [Candidatus Paceibacterota bacterium]HSA03767.1 chemotaxis response regulator protein-glutamate methylesterase [Candidatus Paceibacterota bacterium]
MENQRKIRVLIVDDSALVRKIMSESLAPFYEIEVVGTASDPYIARDKILSLNPDVLTLDIEMPRMDGITFLKLIMKHRPMPVIVVSSLTQAGSSRALEALQSGAVDVLAKPSGSYSAHEDGTKLAEKIKAAALARLGRRFSAPPASPPRSSPKTPLVSPRVTVPSPAPPVPSSPAAGHRQYDPRTLILMGASTGGTEALKHILTALPGDLPGICIVQHIPAYFSQAFANRLNELCQFRVQEARQGDRVSPGLALVAPGGQHMVLRWINNGYQVDLNERPMVHHQRPAVDVLFDSAVKAGAAPHSLAILLTGMGADGAAGLLNLHQAGTTTIAQNEETCVVFGMPREAIRMGAAQLILPLDQIAGRMDRFAAEKAVFSRP